MKVSTLFILYGFFLLAQAVEIKQIYPGYNNIFCDDEQINLFVILNGKIVSQDVQYLVNDIYGNQLILNKLEIIRKVNHDKAIAKIDINAKDIQSFGWYNITFRNAQTSKEISGNLSFVKIHYEEMPNNSMGISDVWEFGNSVSIPINTHAMGIVRKLGFGSIRFPLKWTLIEKFGYGKYDRIVKEASLYGLTILPYIITSPNDISITLNQEKKDLNIPNIKDWENFVSQTSLRYPEIYEWEIWNEQNIKKWWPSDSSTYNSLLVAAFKILHKNNKKVILGATSGIDLNWTKTFLEINKCTGFDMYNIHPYRSVPPDVNGGMKHYGEFSLEDDLTSFNNIIADTNCSKPILITEFGFNTSSKHSKLFFKNTLIEQIENNFKTTLISKNLGIDRIFHFQLVDTFGLHLGLFHDADNNFNIKPIAAHIAWSNQFWKNITDIKKIKDFQQIEAYELYTVNEKYFVVWSKTNKRVKFINDIKLTQIDLFGNENNKAEEIVLKSTPIILKLDEMLQTTKLKDMIRMLE